MRFVLGWTVYILAWCTTGATTLPKQEEGDGWVTRSLRALQAYYPSFQRQSCSFQLELGNDEAQGEARVYITPTSIEVRVQNARPNTLYTVWVDFQSRATGQLSADYPVEGGSVDLSRSGPGIARGVAPAFSKTAPVYEGMRTDVNGFMTDRWGNSRWYTSLDYNLLGRSTSPVTAASLTMQGQNRVGGSWLRFYEGNVFSAASAQSRTLSSFHYSNVPRLVLATAQGLTIVGHYVPVTHGHTPGVGGVDHFPGFKGDFPSYCVGFR